MARGRDPIAEQGQDAAGAADGLAAAHEALKADSSIQFSLQPAPPPPEPPQWLRDVFEWLGEVLRAGRPAVPVDRQLHARRALCPDPAVDRARRGRSGASRSWSIAAFATASGACRAAAGRSGSAAEAEEETWSPEAAPARSWLREADALAAQGRYAEAVHHLLFRSIEDIGRRRPRLVRPALTSRELAAAEALPPPARSLFARIAGSGRAQPVRRPRRSRRPTGRRPATAYADLVLPGTWRA